MDFLLPDDIAMERMRREFEKLDINGRLKAAACALAASGNSNVLLSYAESSPPSADDCADPASFSSLRAYADDETSLSRPMPSADESAPDLSHAEAPSLSSAACPRRVDAVSNLREQKAVLLLLLYLYFMRVLGYNSKYGTQIYDPKRGLGRLRSG